VKLEAITPYTEAAAVDCVFDSAAERCLQMLSIVHKTKACVVYRSKVVPDRLSVISACW